MSATPIEPARRPAAGVRTAIGSIAVATATGAAVLGESAAAGMQWPLRATLAAMLGLGVASLVRVGLVQPLVDSVVSQTRRADGARAELARRDDLDELLARVEPVIDDALDEAEVLDVVGRALAAMLPERATTLLVGRSASSPVDFGYACAAGVAGLDPPRQLATGARCRSVGGRPGGRGRSRGEVVVASTSAVDACDHARREEDEPRSSVCWELRGAEGAVAVIWSTGPEGDLPAPAEMAAVRRLVAIVERRLGAAVPVDEDAAPATRPAVDADRAPADPLTGLPNHVVAGQSLRDLVEGLVPFSVALCNIDGFAAYNDEHGRDVGDRALVLLGAIVRDAVRPTDVVCRYGGDTFLAIFPRCPTLHAAAAMERVRESLVLHLAEDGSPRFTVSTGVADSAQATSIEQLLEDADLAMSMAKYEGGNRVRTAWVEDAPKAGHEARPSD